MSPATWQRLDALGFAPSDVLRALGVVRRAGVTTREACAAFVVLPDGHRLPAEQVRTPEQLGRVLEERGLAR